MEAITTRTARIEVIDDRVVVIARRRHESRPSKTRARTLTPAPASPRPTENRCSPTSGCPAADARGAPQYMRRTPRTSFAAMALLVRGTPLGRTMGNVYLKIARPGIPTRLFAQESKALAWLREEKSNRRPIHCAFQAAPAPIARSLEAMIGGDLKRQFGSRPPRTSWTRSATACTSVGELTFATANLRRAHAEAEAGERRQDHVPA